MLQQLLNILPIWLMQCLPGLLAWGVMTGLLLWVLGARFSRTILSLVAVMSGSWIGVRLPNLFGWSIEPTCVGVFAAFALATAAYLFHRTVVGIGLGVIAAGWAVSAAWIRFDGPSRWRPVEMHWTGNLSTSLARLWQSFAGHLGVVLPYALAAGLASGILTGVLWPRLSRCLLYSLSGTTLIVTAGLPLAARLRPDWLDLAPASGRTQLLILFGFVVSGAAVQWWLSRTPPKPNTSHQPKSPARRPTPTQSLSSPAVALPTRKLLEVTL